MMLLGMLVFVISKTVRMCGFEAGVGYVGARRLWRLGRRCARGSLDFVSGVGFGVDVGGMGGHGIRLLLLLRLCRVVDIVVGCVGVVDLVGVDVDVDSGGAVMADRPRRIRMLRRRVGLLNIHSLKAVAAICSPVHTQACQKYSAGSHCRAACDLATVCRPRRQIHRSLCLAPSATGTMYPRPVAPVPHSTMASLAAHRL